MQLRIVRSELNNYNAGLTIQAFNPDKAAEGMRIFKNKQFICEYRGLLLADEALKDIYGSGTTREYAVQHSVIRSDGVRHLHIDEGVFEPDGNSVSLCQDAALYRSLGALCNEADPPCARVIFDRKRDCNIVVAVRDIYCYEEITVCYTDATRKSDDPLTNYSHADCSGNTMGLVNEDYPRSDNRSVASRVAGTVPTATECKIGGGGRTGMLSWLQSSDTSRKPGGARPTDSKMMNDLDSNDSNDIDVYTVDNANSEGNVSQKSHKSAPTLIVHMHCNPVTLEGTTSSTVFDPGGSV
jgi:hypothetical protein